MAKVAFLLAFKVFLTAVKIRTEKQPAVVLLEIIQLAFTCSNSTTETPEQRLKSA